ncbi:hypothetical protein HII17_18275 [Thalassotalea sp. M1531]|uniref:DNA repair protein n=1 Tax=Thalassotalea algicola TaxID=2716224 RepID=A0A7Y0Q8I2_9GAMM|nr:hypothetical protein [Thalassotalea algicola]NMP33498.1 hypothetical protein [Thalassotalea algicola]
MIAIIVGLIVVLIIIVVVVNAIQQHKEKIESEKRALVAKQKAIIDETEELILNMAMLPENPGLIEVLNRRSLNAAKQMLKIMPDLKGIKNRIQDLESRLQASSDLAANQTAPADKFTLPDNEQQLVQILQCIKKLRITLKSEQTKGVLDAQTFMQHDVRLDSMQVKINIESLLKRGNTAYSKEMLGSARQYYEKALASVSNATNQSEYIQSKRAEIEEKLETITAELKNTNAKDAAKKAKSEEDDLDMLFQPKKKW